MQVCTLSLCCSFGPLSALPLASRTALLSEICGGSPLQLPQPPFSASASSKKSHSFAGRYLPAPSGPSYRHRWDNAMQDAKSASTAHMRALCSRLCWLPAPSSLPQQIPPCLPEWSQGRNQRCQKLKWFCQSSLANQWKLWELILVSSLGF